MSPSRLILVLVATGTLLLGCDAIKTAASGPDEFAVVTRAPLSMPPDYGLRPPRPGAARPNETSPRDDARRKLLRTSENRQSHNSPERQPFKKFTGGEAALLKRADAIEVDSQIRYILQRESGRVKAEKSLVDTLVFWRDKMPAKSLVDPIKEAERLRGNAALGKPATEGETPIFEKK